MRVAIASHDGLFVDEPFGAARRFLIFDVHPRGAAFVELRRNEPPRLPCRAANVHASAIALLPDCDALVVACADPGARRAIARRGLRCFETEDSVASAIRTLAGMADRAADPDASGRGVSGEAALASSF